MFGWGTPPDESKTQDEGAPPDKKRGRIERTVDRVVENTVTDNLKKGSTLDTYLDEKIKQVLGAENVEKLIEKVLRKTFHLKETEETVDGKPVYESLQQAILGAEDVEKLVEKLLEKGTKTDQYIEQLIESIQKELQKWAERQEYILQFQPRPPAKSKKKAKGLSKKKAEGLLPHAPAVMYLKF